MSIRAFFTVKELPTLLWSAANPLTLRPPFKSLVMVSIGLMIFGLGEAMIVAAGIGVSPWTVFSQGLSILTGVSLGPATFITSLLVLLLWVPLRQMPGIGTILNAIIIAVTIDVSLLYLPSPDSFVGAFFMAFFGVLTVGIGSAFYLTCNLGPGPRDGLMTGLQKQTGHTLMNVRIAIEMIVVIAGVLMGGVAGVGTILFAFGIGPAVSACVHSITIIFSRKKGL